MNYLLKSSERRGNRIRPKTIIISFLFALVLFFHFVYPRVLPGLFLTLFQPLLSTNNSIGRTFEEYVSMLRSKRSLISENVILKNNLDQLESTILTLDVLRRENEELKETWGRSTKVNRILSSVLRRPPYSPYDSLIIDTGLDHSLSVGDRVIASGTIVIGEIEEVYAHSSLVVLYSTPERETEVELGKAHIVAKAIGKGGGNFEVSLPQEIDIQVGDSVTLPGIIPSIIGSIEKIDSKPTDSFQTILFKHSFNMSELSWVEVESRVVDVEKPAEKVQKKK